MVSHQNLPYIPADSHSEPSQRGAQTLPHLGTTCHNAHARASIGMMNIRRWQKFAASCAGDLFSTGCVAACIRARPDFCQQQTHKKSRTEMRRMGSICLNINM